jgi:hypothetical protein
VGTVLIGNGSWFTGGTSGTAPVITYPGSLPAGTVGTAYTNTQFLATGSPTITWSITSGTLPTGLTFSSSGLLSGTPTATASGSITFTATNGVGSANLPLSLTVNAVVANTMSLSLPTGTATSYPYQFGRVFKTGVIANYPQVLIDGVAQATQADVKNRWPDGSVKFAIISLIVPSLSTTAKTFTFQNQATVNSTPETKANMLANYDFNCTINATSGGSAITGAPVAARTLLNATSDATLASNTSGDSPNSRYWTQGPICTTVILCDHTSKTYDFGTTADKSLRPIFHVQFWPTLGKYKVRVVVENGDVTKIQTQTYDVSVSTGNASPTTVYTKTGAVHTYNGRWTKAFWSGTAPSSLNVNHNANYLANAKVIFYYDPTAVLTESEIATRNTSWASAAKDIFDAGDKTANVGWEKSMPNVSGRSEIAPLPNWTVDALLSGDYRLQAISDGLAELALAWPMHQREGNSGKYYNAAQTIPGIGFPISLYARPTLFMFDNNYIDSTPSNPADGLTFISGTSAYSWNGWAPDGAHQPAPFLIPYVTTGEFLWLEQMQFWASWATFNPQANTYSGFYGRGPTLSSFGLNGDIRRRAWCLRNRVQAAAFSVDGSKEKTYYDNAVNEAITIEEGIRDVTGGAGYGNAAYVWGQTVGRSGTTGIDSGEYDGRGVHPLRFWDVNYTASNFATNYQALWNVTITRAQAPWQQTYMLLALAHAKDLGYATDGLKNWAGVFVTGAITETNSTGNIQIGNLLGNFVAPVVLSSTDGYIASWAATAAVYNDLTYPRTYVINHIDSPDGEPASMACAIAANYDVSAMPTAWSWVSTNWIANRNPSYPIPSRWRILPRP